MNDLIRSNDQLRNVLLIINGLMLDISSMFITLYFILFGKSTRICVVIILFYAMRVLHQLVYLDPFPENYYFPSPGFPSIVVTYGRQSDFFYSGHCGFTMIVLIECHKLKLHKIMVAQALIFIYTTFMLLSCQVHYTIDIVAAGIYAHYIHLMVSKYESRIDNIGIQLQQQITRCWIKFQADIRALKKPPKIDMELKV